jgi:hypothetical protein
MGYGYALAEFPESNSQPNRAALPFDLLYRLYYMFVA